MIIVKDNYIWQFISIVMLHTNIEFLIYSPRTCGCSICF